MLSCCFSKHDFPPVRCHSEKFNIDAFVYQGGRLSGMGSVVFVYVCVVLFS